MNVIELLNYDNVGLTFSMLCSGYEITQVKVMKNPEERLEIIDIYSGFLIEEVFDMQTIISSEFMEVN